MEQTQALLQVSAKLYQHLTELPLSEQRDEYIEKIHALLDERGTILENIQQQGFIIDPANRSHVMLEELDKGIQERLQKVMNAVKDDMKVLQNAKKNEKQYMNPYSNVAVMDGRYYDKKN